MTKPGIIVLLGLALASAAYGALYFGRTARDRQLEQTCGPELAWIRKEFQLSEADFARVRTLHEAYKPICREYCRRIDEKNGAVATMMMASTNVTPAIEKTLSEAAQLKAQCYAEMIKHFFKVSEAMPPEQGRRYLSWMQSATFPPSHTSMLPHVGPGSSDAPAPHH
ncbi:MAG: periplasmic heavy metal sensor [Verrucomicrobiota bacterium]